MTLIKVKNYNVLDMPSLTRSVLCYIYERHNMSVEDIDLMFDSIHGWRKHIDYKLDMLLEDEELGTIDAEMQFSLGVLLKWLKMDQDGEFEGKKALMKKHKLDYRKFPLHRLPEAYTKKDFEIGAALKKEYNDKNKEQEGLI